jgi:two-component system phosphate regulon sensor histidine kinase PhoR
MEIAWWLVVGIAIAGAGWFCRRYWLENRQLARQVDDLTDQLAETKKDLLDVKARRKKLLSASTQALLIVEDDFTVSSANKVARQFFGPLDKPQTLMAWTRQHKLQELVAQTMQGEKMPPVYFTLGELTLEAHARSIKEEKQIVAVAMAVNDITELQHLTRIRRDFMANVSHELRNPLASIQLLTDTLLRGGLEEADMAHDLVQKIAVQVDLLNQLAQEVLDLSMIESGKLPLKMSTHPLLPLVQTQIERYQPQADRKNITLAVDVAPDLAVLVDDAMIGRWSPTSSTTPSNLPKWAALR